MNIGVAAVRTTSCMAEERVTPAPVAVTVIAEAPGGVASRDRTVPARLVVAPVVVIVNVLITPSAVGVKAGGVNAAFAPTGRPVAVKFTALENPFTAVSLTV